MNIQNNLHKFLSEIEGTSTQLIAVTKTKPIETILEMYQMGWKIFGENKVQELVPKYEALPKDIEWHLIGHLQSNKVKYIAQFVSLIHSVDSPKLLKEIDKQAQKQQRIIDCLIQIHIAEEETKFGFSFEEAEHFLKSNELTQMQNVRVIGVMGMATFTEDSHQVRKEFRSLKQFFDKIKQEVKQSNIDFKQISMGMSDDYAIAIEEGSTMIRIGSAIFGRR
jgi:PLP dependent protein